LPFSTAAAAAAALTLSPEEVNLLGCSIILSYQVRVQTLYSSLAAVSSSIVVVFFICIRGARALGDDCILPWHAALATIDCNSYTPLLYLQTNNTHHNNELIQQITLHTSVLEGVLCRGGIR